MNFASGAITPGYYYLYMPNTLRRLRLEMDADGIAADEILDHTSPDMFCGREYPHSRNLDLGNDQFGQSLSPELSASVCKMTELLKFDGARWFSLHAHYSLFPELAEYLVPELLYGEDDRIDEERQRMKKELKKKKFSRRSVKMPFQELDEDFGYQDYACDNPGRTILERLNYELWEGRSRFGQVNSREIHSMATPYQVVEFKKLVLDGYLKECEAASLLSNAGFLEVIESF